MSKGNVKQGWMYILECSDGSYYTGSTNNIQLRLHQHQNGEGANHTKKRLPIKLVYFEEYQRVDDAFYREKQVQGWSRKKKEALIHGDVGELSHHARNYTQFPRDAVTSTSPATDSPPLSEPANPPLLSELAEDNTTEIKQK